MEFDFRARTSDTLLPSHYFEGDENISLEMYETCMNEGYLSTLSYIKGAAESLGLSIDSETFERWKRICNAAYYVDGYIDTSANIAGATSAYEAGLEQAFSLKNEQILEHQNVTHTTDKRLPALIVLLKNSVRHLEQPQLDELKAAAKNIGQITHAKINCHDIAEYIELLKQEAHHTSILIYGSCSARLHDQKSFDEFVLWCQNAIQLGTLGDSASDIKQDRKQEIMQVRPSVLNFARIAFQMHRPIRAMITQPMQRNATAASLRARLKFYK